MNNESGILRMKSFRQWSAGLLAAILIFTLAPSVSAKNAVSSGAIVQAALPEIGYVEGANEYSKYGKWYGFSNSYWCAMFVSWCANQGGVPTYLVPKGAYCPYMVKAFQNAGRFYDSQSRGGTYIPQQGDIIFYYDSEAYPVGNTTAVHVGIVLYAENGHVFTIEGNSLTCRLDQPPMERDEDLDPPDYVTVNNHTLDYKGILGYGAPDYGNRTPLQLQGFVDLGAYAWQKVQFETMNRLGIVSGTSSHTASPRQGMSRSDFLAALMKLYGLKGREPDTAEFSDVPETHPNHDALMTARSIGVLAGTNKNEAIPDRYINAAEAQAFISRTLKYLGLPEQTFKFTPGDLAQTGDYTIRADLVNALSALFLGVRTPADSAAVITQNGSTLDWTCKSLDSSTYVPLDALQTLYPALNVQLPDEKAEETPEETPSAPTLPTTDETSDQTEETEVSPWTGVSMVGPRVIVTTLTAPGAENTETQITAFQMNGVWYVNLRQAANAANVTVGWDSATGTVTLSR